MTDSVSKWVDVAFKAGPLVAVGLMAILSGQFVTRSEYITAADRFSGRLEAVEKLLIRMESSQEKDKAHDAILSDHETRIRALEKN